MLTVKNRGNIVLITSILLLFGLIIFLTFKTSGLTTILGYLAVFVGLLVITTKGFSKYADGASSVFSSNSKVSVKKDEKVVSNSLFPIVNSKITFKDIAGYDYVKKELTEFIDQIQNPLKYINLGANMIKGVIFHGPPGTGKTYFAQAVAGETGINFISVNGSSFVQEYVGTGPTRVRELFEEARKNSPCIIFIDEFESIASKRTGETMTKEYDTTVTALLTELDGFNVESDAQVLLMCATNKIESIDEAILRPGRIDRKIEINLPDKNTRKKMLQYFTTIKGRKFCKTIDMDYFAEMTYKFSAADLSSMVNEGILIAARKDLYIVDNESLYKAFEKISMGIKAVGQLTENDRKIVAYHEASHAVLTHLLKPEDVIQKVTILPYGNSLGYVHKISKTNVTLYTKETLVNEVKILLAGRAAEEWKFGSVTSGAENDLEKATFIINEMISKYGMFENIAYSEKASQLDINQKLQNYYNEVLSDIKSKYSNYISIVAEYLYKKETVTGKELMQIFNYADSKDTLSNNQTITDAEIEEYIYKSTKSEIL